MRVSTVQLLVNYSYFYSTTSNLPTTPTWISIPDTSTTSKAFTITGLTTYIPYYVWAKATNATNDLTRTSVAILIGPPGPSQNITIESSESRITVKWKVPLISSSPIAAYSVGFDISPNASWPTHWLYNIDTDAYNGSSRPFTPDTDGIMTYTTPITYIIQSGTYYGYVLANNSSGNSKWYPSNNSASVSCTATPNPPTNLSVILNPTNSINISWIAPVGGCKPIGYTLSWYLKNGVGAVRETQTQDKDDKTTNHTINIPKYGYTYYFKVSSKGDTDSSLNSAEVSLFIPPIIFDVQIVENGDQFLRKGVCILPQFLYEDYRPHFYLIKFQQIQSFYFPSTSFLGHRSQIDNGYINLYNRQYSLTNAKMLPVSICNKPAQKIYIYNKVEVGPSDRSVEIDFSSDPGINYLYGTETYTFRYNFLAYDDQTLVGISRGILSTNVRNGNRVEKTVTQIPGPPPSTSYTC
jgi:hypothetical protein